jgi:hypothetical protein
MVHYGSRWFTMVFLSPLIFQSFYINLRIKSALPTWADHPKIQEPHWSVLLPSLQCVQLQQHNYAGLSK